ncbi:hypothetical protein PULV_b0741 [Pseudoalteromonas ulvae UL12]|uniref:Flavin oxidoreductase n=1 Tax=Pseudoalteromonas ulvae TaxID=107327 RepID=A0A244CSW8_PSEDV|nr:flavin reductase [Pseudoalteromonas ulvae]MBE0366016.1 hypothetical protein [Pseudoalteromonas ulvae UL12]OUL58722.1 flavin oxidoreductase [Pseudoalteromonas ulvae]
MMINKTQRSQLDSRYRAMLVNSLSGFKSANLLGTCNLDGHTNLAIISSVFHLGADPALVGFIMRPHTVQRDSLENILATGVYTLNHVNADIWQQSHQTSARYDANQSEFDEVGLTAHYLNECNAPFVKQSRIKYSVELQSSQELVNGTQLVIGEIIDIHVNEELIKPDGYIDIEAAQTVAISGLDGYHTTKQLGRLCYAKPNIDPQLLDDSHNDQA